MLGFSCIKVGASISIPQPDPPCAQAREPCVTQFLLFWSPLVQQEKLVSLDAPGRRLREMALPPPPQHPSLAWDADGTTSKERMDRQFWQSGWAPGAASHG